MQFCWLVSNSTEQTINLSLQITWKMGWHSVSSSLGFRHPWEGCLSLFRSAESHSKESSHFETYPFMIWWCKLLVLGARLFTNHATHPRHHRHDVFYQLYYWALGFKAATTSVALRDANLWVQLSLRLQLECVLANFSPPEMFSIRCSEVGSKVMFGPKYLK